MKRFNDSANQGTTTKSLGRGQSLQTPIGKDSSDYSGKAADEVPAKLKMGGGVDDLSRTLKDKET
jgi:hypothetical protein